MSSDKKITKIEATYQIVTPMFVSGADPRAAELRIPSIKGALRFWWRALHWDGKRNTEELYKEETKLFGGTYTENRKKITLQSKVLLSFKNDTGSTKNPNNYGKNQEIKFNQLSGVSYLGGYGLHGAKAIKEDLTFTVVATFKSTINDKQIEQVKQALIIWGLLGGLGKRSRKAFGSVAIQTLTVNNKKPCDFQQLKLSEYQDEIKKIVNSCPAIKCSYPPYSAFSKYSRIFFGNELKDDSEKVHIDLNTIYEYYKMNPQHPNQDNPKYIATLDAKKKPPCFKFYERKGLGNWKKRRASPMFLHIHPIHNKQQQYIGVRLYLHAKDIRKCHFKLINKVLSDDAEQIWPEQNERK